MSWLLCPVVRLAAVVGGGVYLRVKLLSNAAQPRSDERQDGCPK